MRNYKYVATACILGSVTVISYCLAQAAQKNRPAQLHQNTSPVRSDHPGQSTQVNARIRPYNAALAARDQKYETLLEKGDKVLADNPEEAETYFRDATLVYSYRNDAWKGLAKALDAQGKTSQALSAYHEAFESPAGRGEYSNFPGEVETLARYGILSEAAGQHEEAGRAFTKARSQLNPPPIIPLEMHPDPQNRTMPQLPALLQVVRGVALEHQNKNDEAMTAFKQAASLQPNDSRVQYYLGYGYQKTGQFAASKTAFENAARLDTDGSIKAAAQEKLAAVQNQMR